MLDLSKASMPIQPQDVIPIDTYRISRLLSDEITEIDLFYFELNSFQFSDEDYKISIEPCKFAREDTFYFKYPSNKAKTSFNKRERRPKGGAFYFLTEEKAKTYLTYVLTKYRVDYENKICDYVKFIRVIDNNLVQ